ncbi:hypothetical protein EDD86DRAFT_243858 [Gorgonomyces haynaldii]|nr:hypothetical protein EDD86DRAFT_243858 [Gorgonomyces haynaldii]
MQHIFKLIFLVGVCLSQLTLVHLTAQGNTIDTYALKYPEKKDLFIKEKETIRIIAKLNSTESLLVLNSQTLPLESKKQKLVLDINLGKKAIQTRLDPGENKAVLYWFNEDGKWDLGNWKLSLPPKNDNPLHEIEHKFKPDPPKPNKTIAFGFVGLTLGLD